MSDRDDEDQHRREFRDLCEALRQSEARLGIESAEAIRDRIARAAAATLFSDEALGAAPSLLPGVKRGRR
jgi:hypothetical protein